MSVTKRLLWGITVFLFDLLFLDVHAQNQDLPQGALLHPRRNHPGGYHGAGIGMNEVLKFQDLVSNVILSRLTEFGGCQTFF